jgi:hypothetical protein
MPLRLRGSHYLAEASIGKPGYLVPIRTGLPRGRSIPSPIWTGRNSTLIGLSPGPPSSGSA